MTNEVQQILTKINALCLDEFEQKEIANAFSNIVETIYPDFPNIDDYTIYNSQVDFYNEGVRLWNLGADTRKEITELNKYIRTLPAFYHDAY